MNAFAEKKSFDAQRLLRCSWEDLTPSEEDLVREPLLRELCQWSPPAAAAASSTSGDAGVEETKGEEGVALAETKEDAGGGGRKTSGARKAVGLVFGKKGGGIAARFEVLQQVNRKLRDALPYFDLTQVCRVRNFLFASRICCRGRWVLHVRWCAGVRRSLGGGDATDVPWP